MAFGPAGSRPLPRLGEGRFRIVELLGDGGTAAVYLAWDARDRRWCALKALLHKHVRDQEMRRRFRLEAETMLELDHPNIPRVIAHDQEAAPPWIAMELARCGSAMDWVRENGAMPPSMAADVIFQVCEALSEAHAKGIVHRDVKPHNFLLDDEGRCKLTDFGIARVDENTSLTATGTQIGTFSYMAPEQRSDTKSVDLRADVYSVGASLYTLLTARTSAELFVADKDDELLQSIPAAFREVILDATRYRREDRYAAVHDLQTELMSALSRIPSQEGDYPPLVRPHEALPEEPPEYLAFGVRFEDLERSMALDMDQPTFVPSRTETARLLEELDDPPPPATPAPQSTPPPEDSRKLIPYYMPSRNLSGPSERTTELPDVPGWIDAQERGAVQRAEERAWVQREVQASIDTPPRVAAPPVPDDDEEEPISLSRLMGAIVAGVGIAAVFLVGLLVWGSMGVGDAREETLANADAFLQVLEDESGVVYELPGDRQRFEQTYQRYTEARGHERLLLGLELAALLEEQQRAGTVSPLAEGRLRQIQTARDAYLDAQRGWVDIARRFPGVLAVKAGLAPAP